MCLSENTVRQWLRLWSFCSDSSGTRLRGIPIPQFLDRPYFFIIGNPSDQNPCELVMSNEIAFGTLFPRGVRVGLASNVTMTPAFSGYCWEKMSDIL